MFRKTIALLLTCLILQPLCTVQDAIGSQQSLEERTRQEGVKAKVTALGIGAVIKAQLRFGMYQGQIVEIQDQAFVLDENGKKNLVRYDEVLKIALAESKYRAQGAVDPNRVHQVVVDMGIGKEVVVRLVSKKTIRGKIGAIQDKSFTILDPKAGVSTPVTYSAVLEINRRERLPRVAITIAVIAGGVALLIGVIFASFYQD